MCVAFCYLLVSIICRQDIFPGFAGVGLQVSVAMFCLSSFLSLLCTGIREERPSRELLKDYFAVDTPQSRHWHGLSLAQAVLKGLQLMVQEEHEDN